MAVLILPPPQIPVVVCQEGDVRLVGGANNNEGRVEVCRLEQWLTVCNNGFDSMEAGVVCSQLGFSRRSKISLVI